MFILLDSVLEDQSDDYKAVTMGTYKHRPRHFKVGNIWTLGAQEKDIIALQYLRITTQIKYHLKEHTKCFQMIYTFIVYHTGKI